MQLLINGDLVKRGVRVWTNESPHTLHHDGVIKWKYFPRYCPFVGGIHRSPVNSPHKGQWHRALICAWINGWVNNREVGDLRRRRADYDVIVMYYVCCSRSAVSCCEACRFYPYREGLFHSSRLTPSKWMILVNMNKSRKWSHQNLKYNQSKNKRVCIFSWLFWTCSTTKINTNMSFMPFMPPTAGVRHTQRGLNEAVVLLGFPRNIIFSRLPEFLVIFLSSQVGSVFWRSS